MRKLFTLLVLAMLCVGMTLVASAEDYPEIEAVRAQTSINIDGNFGEVWETANSVNIAADDPIVQEYGQSWADVPEGEAEIWTMWDEDYFYIFAKVVDNDVVANVPDNVFLNDAIGIFMQYPEKEGNGGFKIPIAPNPGGDPIVGVAPIGPGGATIDPDVAEVAVKITEDGYHLEAAISWEEVASYAFDYSPQAGDIARFTLLLLDASGEGQNDTWGQTMWVGNGDDASVYAYLEFTN